MTVSQRMWKREQERKRRERLKRARRRRNCTIAVVLLAIIAVSVIVSSTKTDKAPQPKETQTPVAVNLPSDTAVITEPYTTTRKPDDIKKSFFKDSAFAGNALAETIGMYGLLPESDFYAGVNVDLLNVYKVTTSGSTTSIAEQFKSKRFNKVFLAFGENELKTMTSSEFKSKYRDLADKLLDYQPKARIYLIAIPPVTAKVSESNDKITDVRIREFNKKIMSLAVDLELYYIDSTDALGDNKDFLPNGVSADGINLNKDAVIDLLYYSAKEAYIPNTNDLAEFDTVEDEEENETAEEDEQDEQEDEEEKPQETLNSTPAPTVNVLKDSAINKKREE